MLIDQQHAHERIRYERYLKTLGTVKQGTQRQLFPKQIQLSTIDAQILENILSDIQQLGIDLQAVGDDSFIVHGLPTELKEGTNEQELIETLIEQYRLNLDYNLSIHDNLARSMAKGTCIKRGQFLSTREMTALIDQLFACDVPYKSPSGHHCFLTYNLDDLKKQFHNQ